MVHYQMPSTIFKYVWVVGLLACTRGTAANDSSTAQATRADSATRPAANNASRANTSRKRRVLFVGTSLTAGYGLDADSAYPQQIQRMIDSAQLGFEVVNAGISGETSSDLLRRLDWLLRQPLDVIVIETGANDGLRGIPIETMRSNIRRIIDRVRAARPSAKIALIQMEALPNLGIAYTRSFRAVFPEVAKESNVALLPFLLQDVAGRHDLNQADGIHPNYEGERIVARNVWKGLSALLQ